MFSGRPRDNSHDTKTKRSSWCAGCLSTPWLLARVRSLTPITVGCASITADDRRRLFLPSTTLRRKPPLYRVRRLGILDGTGPSPLQSTPFCAVRVSFSAMTTPFLVRDRPGNGQKKTSRPSTPSIPQEGERPRFSELGPPAMLSYDGIMPCGVSWCSPPCVSFHETKYFHFTTGRGLTGYSPLKRLIRESASARTGDAELELTISVQRERSPTTPINIFFVTALLMLILISPLQAPQC